MKFDIDKVITDMSAAVKDSVGKDWNDVKDIANQFLQNNKERLKMIAELRLNGELTQEEFESRLIDNKLVMEAELNAIAVLSKAIAQNAVNAAIDVLIKAVNAAAKTLL